MKEKAEAAKKVAEEKAEAERQYREKLLKAREGQPPAKVIIMSQPPTINLANNQLPVAVQNIGQSTPVQKLLITNNSLASTVASPLPAGTTLLAPSATTPLVGKQSSSSNVRTVVIRPNNQSLVGVLQPSSSTGVVGTLQTPLQSLGVVTQINQQPGKLKRPSTNYSLLKYSSILPKTMMGSPSASTVSVSPISTTPEAKPTEDTKQSPEKASTPASSDKDTSLSEPPTPKQNVLVLKQVGDQSKPSFVLTPTSKVIGNSLLSSDQVLVCPTLLTNSSSNMTASSQKLVASGQPILLSTAIRKQ